MRALIFTCLTCLFLLTAFPAFASDPNAVVFPPSNCSRGEQRVITWQDGTTTTICATGQQVMRLAIPNCEEEQQVVFKSGQFVCTNKPSLPAACDTGEVLTYTSNGFICVKVGENIPTCAADQFLTYNGSTFQCASTQKLALPVCGKGEVLTSDGINLTCTALQRGGRPCQSRVYGTFVPGRTPPVTKFVYEEFPGTNVVNGLVPRSTMHTTLMSENTYIDGEIGYISGGGGSFNYFADGSIDYAAGISGAVSLVQCVDGTWKAK